MFEWYSFLETFKTGSGFWNPLVWGVAAVIAFLIIYIIRGQGEKDYKRGTEQTKVFLSGNPEFDDKEKMHVKGSNVYWGFMETLQGVYKTLSDMHTGVVSDYVLWFIIVLGLFLIVLVGVF